MQESPLLFILRCVIDAEPPSAVSLNPVQRFENELVTNLGGTISARCIGGPLGQWLMDGDDFTTFIPLLNIRSVTDTNAGFYQCLIFMLSFPEFEITNTVASFYALIQGNDD